MLRILFLTFLGGFCHLFTKSAKATFVTIYVVETTYKIFWKYNNWYKNISCNKVCSQNL